MAAAGAPHARQEAMGTARGVTGSAEFSVFLAIYNALVARFGAAADERFARPEQHHEGAAAAVQLPPTVPVRRTAPGPWRNASPEPRTCGTTEPAHGVTRR
jgi:hypothetical protein